MGKGFKDLTRQGRRSVALERRDRRVRLRIPDNDINELFEVIRRGLAERLAAERRKQTH